MPHPRESPTRCSGRATPLNLATSEPLNHRSPLDEARLPFSDEQSYASLQEIDPARMDALDVVEPHRQEKFLRAALACI
jgi:hypothetical protein